jgi:hypothetical protein
MKVVRVDDGWLRYQEAMIASGRRMGDIKPTCLDILGIAAAAFSPGRIAKTVPTAA